MRGHRFINKRSFQCAGSSRLPLVVIGPALLLFVSVSAAGLDFGGVLEQSVEAQRDADEEVGIGLDSTAQVFVRRNPVVDGPLTLRWDAEASARYHTFFQDGDHDDDRWIFDVDRLDLRWIAPEAVADNSVFRGSVGRFPFSEPSGLIFDDRIDGASLSIDFPAVTASVSAGYTGLLTKENSPIVLSLDDEDNMQDDDVRLAPPRVISNLSFVFPEIVGRQSAGIETLAQWDLRNVIDDIDQERVHSQYLYLTGNGPITDALYYEFAVAGSSLQRATVSENDENDLGDPEQEFGLAAHVRSELFLDQSGRNLLTGTLRYGSGSQRPFDTFPAAAAPGLGLLEEIGVSDTTAAILDYSFNPYADRRGAAARRLEIGLFTAAEYSADLTESDSYRGAEIGTRFTTRPFSEFGAQVQAGARYDNGEDEVLPRGRLELSTRF